MCPQQCQIIPGELPVCSRHINSDKSSFPHRGQQFLRGDGAHKHQGTELSLQPPPEPTAGACRTHIKDLEACNVQHPDEELPGQFGVQSLVDSGHQPLEHAVVGGFSQGSHSVEHLPRTPRAHSEPLPAPAGATAPESSPGTHGWTGTSKELVVTAQAPKLVSHSSQVVSCLPGLRCLQGLRI